MPLGVEEEFGIDRLTHFCVLGSHVIRPCRFARNRQIQTILGHVGGVAESLKLPIVGQHAGLYFPQTEPAQVLVDFIM